MARMLDFRAEAQVLVMANSDSSKDKILWFSISPKKKKAQANKLAQLSQIQKLPGTDISIHILSFLLALETI